MTLCWPPLPPAAPGGSPVGQRFMAASPRWAGCRNTTHGPLHAGRLSSTQATTAATNAPPPTRNREHTMRLTSIIPALLILGATASLRAETVADQLNANAAARDQNAAIKDQNAAASELHAAGTEQAAIANNKAALGDDKTAAHQDAQAAHKDGVAIRADDSALHKDESALHKADASGNAGAAAADKAHIASDEAGLHASEAARANARFHENRDLAGERRAERGIRTERWQRNRDELDAGRDERHALGAEAGAARATDAIGHDESMRDAEHRDFRSFEREGGADFRGDRAEWHNRQANRQERRSEVHLENGERRDAGSEEREDRADIHERNGIHRNHRE